jgi:hypothetical protein
MTHDTTTHIHDPDPPFKRIAENSWLPEEVALLQKLREQNFTYRQIAERLSRPWKGVRAKLARMRMTPEMRKRYNENERLRGKKFLSPRKVAGITYMAPEISKVPPELLADREARHAAPRDLTGLICGDPPRGFSALERRA